MKSLSVVLVALLPLAIQGAAVPEKEPGPEPRSNGYKGVILENNVNVRDINTVNSPSKGQVHRGEEYEFYCYSLSFGGPEFKWLQLHNFRGSPDYDYIPWKFVGLGDGVDPGFCQA